MDVVEPGVLQTVDEVLLDVLAQLAEGESQLQLEAETALILSESRPDRAAVFARVMKVLDIVQELAIADATSTQRDVYYRLGDLMPETLMRTSAQAYQAIEHAASLLGKTPADLGIACASKGLVGGNVRIRVGAGVWMDGTGTAIPIPGSMDDVMSMQLDMQEARFIFVVEKEAVFQRLMEDRIFDSVPAVVLTAKGIPDQASRALLHRMHMARPDVPLLGVVDFNPAGVVVLSAFLQGGRRRDAFAVPVQWLGVRRSQLDELGVGPDRLRPLSPSELRILDGLEERLAQAEMPGWLLDLAEMRDFGRKVETEHLGDALGRLNADNRGPRGLTAYLVQLALARQFIPAG